MLLWADGFDHYGNSAALVASGLYSWTTNDQSEPLRIGNNPAYVRTGRYYWDATGQIYNNWYAGRLVGGTSQVLGCGAAFLFLGAPVNDGYCPIMFVSGGKDNTQASVRLHVDGSLSVHTGRDGDQLAISAPGVIVWGAYAYIEAKVYADQVQGAMEVRVNNQEVISIQGVNTDPTGTGIATGVMSGTRGGTQMYGNNACTAISDYVIWDNSGDHNNDFFGDIRCRTIYPAGNGLNQDWTPHGQADAFNCINQVPAQPGVDYISADAPLDLSTFNLQPIPNNTGAIYGACVFANLNKSDAGVCTMQFGLASSGATDFTDPIAIGTGAAYYTKRVQVDPKTGNPFTVAAANAMQAIVERVQ